MKTIFMGHDFSTPLKTHEINSHENLRVQLMGVSKAIKIPLRDPLRDPLKFNGFFMAFAMDYT